MVYFQAHRNVFQLPLQKIFLEFFISAIHFHRFLSLETSSEEDDSLDQFEPKKMGGAVACIYQEV